MADEHEDAGDTASGVVQTLQRVTPVGLWVVAAASAIGAVLSPARPTGLRPADALWCALLGALVPLVASRAHRSAVLWTGAVAAVVGIGGDATAKVCAVVLLGLLGVVAFSGRRERLELALIGGLAVQALLRGPSYGFVGLPTLVGVAALVPPAVSAYRVAHRWEKRRARTWALIAAAVVVVLSGMAAVGALATRQALKEAADTAISGLDTVRAGDTAGGAARFTDAADRFADASNDLSGPLLWGGRIVPIVGLHVRALQDAASAGEALSQSAATTSSSADYRTLTARGGQVDLAQVTALQAPVADSAATAEKALATVAAARSPWLLAPVGDELARFDEKLADAADQARIAADGLALAPALLGADGGRTYVVSFANPAESRNGGGYVGAYGLLTAVHGKLDLVESGKLNAFDKPRPDPGYAFQSPPDWQERYGDYWVQNYLGNHSASPDWPTGAGVIGQLFPQTPVGMPVDGALYVDPKALAGLLQLTGGITLPDRGIALDAGNVERFLLVDQYELFGGQNPGREDLLGDVAQATFDALTSRELPGISRLTEVLGPLVSGGHLRISAADEAPEAFLDRVGLSGAWPVTEGSDYLSVRSADLLSNKIDAFLHRDITADATVDPDRGTVRTLVTVQLRNDAPSSGLSDYVIGNTDGLPTGTNKNLVSVYTPHDLVRITIDGQPSGYLTQTELGAQVHMAEVVLPPGSTRSVTFELVGAVPSWPYSLELVPQATANTDRLTVDLDGVPGMSDGRQFSGDWARMIRMTQPATTKSGRQLTEGSDA